MKNCSFDPLQRQINGWPVVISLIGLTLAFCRPAVGESRCEATFESHRVISRTSDSGLVNEMADLFVSANEAKDSGVKRSMLGEFAKKLKWIGEEYGPKMLQKITDEIGHRRESLQSSGAVSVSGDLVSQQRKVFAKDPLRMTRLGQLPKNGHLLTYLDSTRVLLAEEKTLKVFDLIAQKELARINANEIEPWGYFLLNDEKDAGFLMNGNGIFFVDLVQMRVQEAGVHIDERFSDVIRSADGKMVVARGHTRPHLFRIEDRQIHRIPLPQELIPHEDRYYDISPDGRYLTQSQGADFPQIFDLRTGQKVAIHSLDALRIEPLNFVTFAADSKTLWFRPNPDEWIQIDVTSGTSKKVVSRLGGTGNFHVNRSQSRRWVIEYIGGRSVNLNGVPVRRQAFHILNTATGEVREVHWKFGNPDLLSIDVMENQDRIVLAESIFDPKVTKMFSSRLFFYDMEGDWFEEIKLPEGILLGSSLILGPDQATLVDISRMQVLH